MWGRQGGAVVIVAKWSPTCLKGACTSHPIPIVYLQVGTQGQRHQSLQFPDKPKLHISMSNRSGLLLLLLAPIFFRHSLSKTKYIPLARLSPGGITLHLSPTGREGCGRRRQSWCPAAHAPPPWPPSRLSDLPLDPRKLQTFCNHPISVMSFFQENPSVTHTANDDVIFPHS